MNIPDSNGDTPFQLCVIQGDHNILDMLLMNAALLATNSKGHNVLHIASLKVRLFMNYECLTSYSYIKNFYYYYFYSYIQDFLKTLYIV